jgi:hypothetical protein
MPTFRRLAVTAALALAAIAPATASAGPYFSQTSFWNKPLATNAALDARSATWVNKVSAQVKQYGHWINTTQYSVPIYTVSSTQPGVQVKMDGRNWDPKYWADFAAVPLPGNAVPAAGTDRHLVVHQTGTDSMWEFWELEKKADGWHAGAGAKIAKQASSNGIVPVLPNTLFPEPFGATATALPAAGGLILPSELKAGVINHVVAAALPETLLQWWWSWPAQRSDGNSVDPYQIPEGARLRLPASLDVTKLGLTRTGTIIARAIQKYGMVIRDRAGAVVLYMQDPVSMQTNPYPGLIGMDNAAVLNNFPWDKMQVLQTQPNQALPS